MAYLEIGGRRHTIVVGELRLGSDASCQLALSGSGIAAVHAVLQGFPDGQVAIRRAADDLEVLINGVRLGPQPTPLLHGDKVQIGGQELLFVDERRSGSTQYVAAVDPGQLSSAKKSGKAGQATGSTGGRVVSLTDGREYSITGASMVFGREAGCDVVITDKNVSRRHCEIMVTPKGYVLVDSSTNGTFVNGERVESQRVLLRADVIRVGSDEFRFYADVAPAPPSGGVVGGPAGQSGAPAPAAAAPLPLAGPQAVQAAAPSAVAAPAATPTPAPPVPVAAPPGAERRLAHTLAGVPGQGPALPSSPARGGENLAEETLREGAAARPAAGGVLANVLVRSGPLKGQRLPIRVPIVNVGRADYNDIVLQDDSVSTSHAKLQRREGVWILVDLDSTNGTFVDGERVQGETPLAPGALIRFGDVQTMFEPTDDTIDASKGASTKVMGAIKAPPAPAAAPSPAPAPKPPAVAPAAERPTTPAPKTPAAQPPRRPAPPPRPKAAEPAAGSSPKWLVPVVIVIVILIAFVGFLLTR